MFSEGDTHRFHTKSSTAFLGVQPGRGIVTILTDICLTHQKGLRRSAYACAYPVVAVNYRKIVKGSIPQLIVSIMGVVFMGSMEI